MSTPASTTSKRLAVAAGAAGLLGGLALGATGLAGAVSPSPTPTGPQAGAPERGGPPPGRMGWRMREHRGGAGGLVAAVSESSLTLRTPAGTKTIGLTAATVFYDGKDKATQAAVKVGEIVHVRLVDPRATTPVAAVVRVLPAHLEGWVTSVSGDTITITDHDGFTRTIRTSDGTAVTKDGADSSLAAVTVGSFVGALGDVDAAGTTLDAKRIVLGRPSGVGGPVGFGLEAPDGPSDQVEG